MSTSSSTAENRNEATAGKVMRMDTLKSGWTHYVYYTTRFAWSIPDSLSLEWILQIRLSSSIKIHDRSHKVRQKTEENSCVV